MGIEMSILCDSCGRDCTNDHYSVSIMHKLSEGQSEQLICKLSGSIPYLCRECFEIASRSFFSYIEGLTWEQVDSDFDADFPW